MSKDYKAIRQPEAEKRLKMIDKTTFYKSLTFLFNESMYQSDIMNIREYVKDLEDKLHRRNALCNGRLREIKKLQGQVKELRKKPEGLYEVYCGAFETMKEVAIKGAKGLNSKTHKWQIIDTTAKYYIMPDGIGAILYSNLDLHKIAKEKELII